MEQKFTSSANPTADFDVLILAAGASKRMTGIKQLLPVGNTTFIELTIEKAIELKPRHIVVVLGAYLNEIMPAIEKQPVSLIENPQWQLGMGLSIAWGVNYISEQFGPAAGLLILLCDQVLILQDKTFLENLISQWRNSPQEIVATRYSEKYGVPALFPAGYMVQLKNLKGDKGARVLLNSGQFAVTGIDCGELAGDIDTDEAYQLFLAKNQTCLDLNAGALP